MKKSIYLSLLALSVVAYSCSKDDNNNDTPKKTVETRSINARLEITGQEKLMGKWDLMEAIDHNFYENVSRYDSTFFQQGERSLEFRYDTVIAFSDYNPQRDTATYQLIDNDKKLVINGNITFTVNYLTDSTMQMYLKEQYKENEYYEEWTTFKKR